MPISMLLGFEVVVNEVAGMNELYAMKLDIAC